MINQMEYNMENPTRRRVMFVAVSLIAFGFMIFLIALRNPVSSEEISAGSEENTATDQAKFKPDPLDK